MSKRSDRIKKTAQYHARRMARMLFSPMVQRGAAFKKNIGLKELRVRVKKDIEGRKAMILEAQSFPEKDYVAVGSRMMAKKLFYVAGIALPLAAIVLRLWGIPFLQSKFFTKEMEINSPEMYRYTGKVRLLAPGTDMVLFEGRLSEGTVTGQGRLYDYGGNLVYEGGFENNRYEGFGYLYGEDGALVYEGMFRSGQYDGTDGLAYGITDAEQQGAELQGGEPEDEEQRGEGQQDEEQQGGESEDANGREENGSEVYGSCAGRRGAGGITEKRNGSENGST